MIILAPFYKDTDFLNEGSEVQKMSQIFDYKKNLTRLQETCYRLNPLARLEICTDLHTTLSSDFNVHRTDLKNYNLMESFCVSNLDFVKSKNHKMILCGADHLVNGSLSELFEENFDIAIPVVDNPIRVNNTLILVNPEKNKKKIVEFFERRYETYKKLSQDQKLWSGDQLSYQKILEEEKILDINANFLPLGDFVVNGLKIKLFRYGSHFVGPIKKGMPPKGSPVIIDFKGPKRKKRIVEIYQNLMN